MRPHKRSAAVEARLDEVARLKFETPTYRELEIETGICATYLRELVAAKIQALTDQCMDTYGA